MKVSDEQHTPNSAHGAFPELRAGDLDLVQLAQHHAQGYADILSDPDTWYFLTDSGPVDLSQAREKIERSRSKCDAGRAMYWAITEKAGAFLGFIALHNLASEMVSVSFGIHPSCRKSGIATQALHVVLNWAADQQKTVEATAHLENIASYNLLMKSSLQYQGVRMTKFGERHVFSSKY